MSEWMATTTQVGLAKLIDQFGMRAPGSQCIDAGIELYGRLHAAVTKYLPDQFVGTRIAIEDDLRAEVSELMRSYLDAQMAQNSFGDCDRNGSLTPWLASVRHEQFVWLPADNGGRDLAPINMDTIGQKRRQLEFEPGRVLSFFCAEGEKRRLSWPLWPVQVHVERDRTQIRHAQRGMQKDIDRQSKSRNAGP